jgi:hypothetical protein
MTVDAIRIRIAVRERLGIAIRNRLAIHGLVVW